MEQSRLVTLVRTLAPALAWTLASLAATGCGVPSHIEQLDKNSARMADQIEQDQQYMKSVAEEMKRLSNVAEHFEKLGDDLSAKVAGSPAQDIPAAPIPMTSPTPAPSWAPVLSDDELFGPKAKPSPAAPAPTSEKNSK